MAVEHKIQDDSQKDAVPAINLDGFRRCTEPGKAEYVDGNYSMNDEEQLEYRAE